MSVLLVVLPYKRARTEGQSMPIAVVKWLELPGETFSINQSGAPVRPRQGPPLDLILSRMVSESSVSMA